MVPFSDYINMHLHMCAYTHTHKQLNSACWPPRRKKLSLTSVVVDNRGKNGENNMKQMSYSLKVKKTDLSTTCFLTGKQKGAFRSKS